jgi:hypothetical protein
VTKPVEHARHQCLADAPTLIGGQHFQQRNEAAEHAIGERGHKSNNLTTLRGDREHHMIAAGEQT